jgi:hypothetical protein
VVVKEFYLFRGTARKFRKTEEAKEKYEHARYTDI